MAGKSDALAKTFETKAADATKAIEGISDADWKKVTSAEKRPVGVVAHHIAKRAKEVDGLLSAEIADVRPQEHQYFTLPARIF